MKFSKKEKVEKKPCKKIDFSGYYQSFIEKLSHFLTKGKFIILAVFLVITALCGYGISLTNINSDVLSYLPDDSTTDIGMDFLSDNFSVRGNIVMAIDKDTPYEKVKTLASSIAQTIPETTSVLWIGAIDDLANTDVSIQVGSATLSGKPSELAPDLMAEIKEKAESVLLVDDNYLVMVLLSEPPSSKRSIEILEEIDTLADDIWYEWSGTTPISVQVYTDAISELPFYILLAVGLVAIVLVLTASSYVEPLIFMATLGVAVVINMGTNFLFGEVSIITFCASAILQLALSMDYAIFLTHMYKEEKAKYPNDGMLTLGGAMKRTIPTIFASGLTTIGGLSALFLMSFTLGKDMGGVLIKGIVISLLTVMLLQPCLLLIFGKAIDKTKKKALDFKFHKVTKFGIKTRVIIVIVVLLLFGPAFYGQHVAKLSYLDFLPKKAEENHLTEIVSGLSNQMLIAAPYEDENVLDHKEYVQTLMDTENISAVTGFFAMMPPSMFGEDGRIYYNIEVGDYLLKADLTDALIEQGENLGFLSKGYAMYMVAISNTVNVESPEATKTLESTTKINEDFFQDNFYISGLPQGVYDFQNITPKDFLWINILTAVLVFVVLIFTFRSIKFPILLLALIEFGLWINYTMFSLIQGSINFLSYLIVSSIQLGATIDYAILVTSKYRELRKEGKNGVAAAYYAGSSCSMSVLTSATIMIVACISVAVLTSNDVIREIASMVAVGAFISGFLVLTVLPSILALASNLKREIKESSSVKEFVNIQLDKIQEEFNAIRAIRKLEDVKQYIKGSNARIDAIIEDCEKSIIPEDDLLVESAKPCGENLVEEAVEREETVDVEETIDSEETVDSERVEEICDVKEEISEENPDNE